MSSAAYRSIARKFGVSLRNLSEHRARGHHEEEAQAATVPDDDPSTFGPWLHADLMFDMLDAVLASMPLDSQRVRLIDAVEQLEQDHPHLLRDYVQCHMTEDELADTRRTRAGLIRLPYRSEDGWELTWLKYRSVPGEVDKKLLPATDEEIAVAAKPRVPDRHPS